MHPTDPAAKASVLPYPYGPPAQPWTAAAFGPLFKVLAWGMVLALFAWFWRLDFEWPSPQAQWFAVVWTMLVFMVWHIQRSRITLSGEAIEQSWMWRRRLALHELAYVKVMRIRGLEPLVAPRIYARSLSGTFVIFYCHDPALLDEFARLALALEQHAHRL